jgi:hypothetical protein
MNSVDEIRRLWDEWKTIPFPSGFAGQEVEGFCVTSIDTFAAGCIDTFVSSKGRLDEPRIKVLQQCRNELEIVVKTLDGNARTYFNDLLVLCRRVLQSLGR